MSGTLLSNEPDPYTASSPSIELVIEARPRDLGGFEVRRVLPSAQRRLVGPFIFFDQMGPAAMTPGAGIDVRPHPHIGLATVTYLFEGEILHRDSIGSFQAIRPGDVNWMVAGRGIVHSERSSAEERGRGVRVHGLQCWVALPIEQEQCEPSFQHHPAASIPRLERAGAVIDVVAGTAYGAQSPVVVAGKTLYAHVLLAPGADLEVDDTHEERAVYVIEGTITCDGRTFGVGIMVVLRPGANVTITSAAGARVMLAGGAHLPGERFIEWNFVSSSRQRLAQAKDDWHNGRFPRVPGDEVEFIPLPPS